LPCYRLPFCQNRTDIGSSRFGVSFGGLLTALNDAKTRAEFHQASSGFARGHSSRNGNAASPRGCRASTVVFAARAHHRILVGRCAGGPQGTAREAATRLLWSWRQAASSASALHACRRAQHNDLSGVQKMPVERSILPRRPSWDSWGRVPPANPPRPSGGARLSAGRQPVGSLRYLLSQSDRLNGQQGFKAASRWAQELLTGMMGP
jgi:hypothetical protein